MREQSREPSGIRSHGPSECNPVLRGRNPVEARKRDTLPGLFFLLDKRMSKQLESVPPLPTGASSRRYGPSEFLKVELN